MTSTSWRPEDWGERLEECWRRFEDEEVPLLEDEIADAMLAAVVAELERLKEAALYPSWAEVLKAVINHFQQGDK